MNARTTQSTERTHTATGSVRQNRRSTPRPLLGYEPAQNFLRGRWFMIQPTQNFPRGRWIVIQGTQKPLKARWIMIQATLSANTLPWISKKCSFWTKTTPFQLSKPTNNT